MSFKKYINTILLSTVFASGVFSQTQINKIPKRGLLTIKGIVTANGKPIGGVGLLLQEYFPLTRSFDGKRFDYERVKSSVDGKYEIKIGINNFYSTVDQYSIHLAKGGYPGKLFDVIPVLPVGVMQITFSLELPLELNDTNQCGQIVWSEEKKSFVVKWYQCPKDILCLRSYVGWPKVGERIVLENIYFETDKSVLLPSSFEELNRLATFVDSSKNTIIEITGHTDNAGPEERNKKLSEARAKAVVDYLIAKGIDKARISYKGYGSSMPLSKNDTEAGRQKNRRVEFIIK